MIRDSASLAHAWQAIDELRAEVRRLAGERSKGVQPQDVEDHPAESVEELIGWYDNEVVIGPNAFRCGSTETAEALAKSLRRKVHSFVAARTIDVEAKLAKAECNWGMSKDLLASVDTFAGELAKERDTALARAEKAEAERDELRARIEGLGQCIDDLTLRNLAADTYARERDEAVSAFNVLRSELHADLIAAFERGAEAMRKAAVCACFAWWDHSLNGSEAPGHAVNKCVEAIRALPLPRDPGDDGGKKTSETEQASDPTSSQAKEGQRRSPDDRRERPGSRSPAPAGSPEAGTSSPTPPASDWVEEMVDGLATVEGWFDGEANLTRHCIFVGGHRVADNSSQGAAHRHASIIRSALRSRLSPLLAIVKAAEKWQRSYEKQSGEALAASKLLTAVTMAKGGAK